MGNEEEITKALEFLTGESTWNRMARLAEMVALYGAEELEVVDDEAHIAPVFETSDVAELAQLSTRKAYSLLNKMASAGLVTRCGGGKGNGARWSL